MNSHRISGTPTYALPTQAILPFENLGVFLPIDGQDDTFDVSALPCKDICFRKPNLADPKATDRELERAKRAMGMAEQD